MPSVILRIDDPVSQVPLIGPSYVSRLSKIDIKTVGDLLYYLPFRYDDFSLVSSIASIQDGETVTVRGKVEKIKNEYARSGLAIQKALVSDSTGEIEVVWFNQRFLTQAIHAGDEVSLSGKIKRSGKKLQLVSPKYEVIYGTKTPIHTGRLVPVYSETAGISSKWLRSRIQSLLTLLKSNSLEIIDNLDNDVREKYHLLPLDFALQKVHFPDSLEQAEMARQRLAFDELLKAQLNAIDRKIAWQSRSVGNKFDIIGKKGELKKIVDNLPFTLTRAQKRVVDEIYKDLASNVPMNRLLQGDVGSGKTVVAALALVCAYLNGYSSALMAPTEILAEQHFNTIDGLLEPLGIKPGLVTGTRKDNLDARIIIGTHALLSDRLNFKNLGLVIIDEQHRFGVEQRETLIQKGVNPHVLTMTATPIPRTVALTLLGDLEISILDEKPTGRIPVKTWLVPTSKRTAAYNWIISQRTQTFLICPRVDEAEIVASEIETTTAVKAAVSEFKRLSETVFKGHRLGLLHGRLSSKEKDRALGEFKSGKIDVLVTTPVVEVGIDVPNATVIVIEGADRFGLAQLHQLRGRVGRTSVQSYCLLFTDSNTPESIKRLRYLESTHEGLDLAEYDLKFRGPGQRFGTAQHGKWDLKIADFSNLDLIRASREAAESLVSNSKYVSSLRKALKKGKIAIN